MESCRKLLFKGHSGPQPRQHLVLDLSRLDYITHTTSTRHFFCTAYIALKLHILYQQICTLIRTVILFCPQLSIPKYIFIFLHIFSSLSHLYSKIHFYCRFIKILFLCFFLCFSIQGGQSIKHFTMHYVWLCL